MDVRNKESISILNYTIVALTDEANTVRQEKLQLPCAKNCGYEASDP